MAHQTIETLLNSLERSEKRRFTHSELARALNVSEQVITNWASRGMSVEGALNAQLAFHKDANFLLGRVSHPMMLPRQYSQAAPEPPANEHIASERRVQYLPDAAPDDKKTELLELFDRLDADGKKEWLADLRGFVRGRRPHSDGHFATVARKK